MRPTSVNSSTIHPVSQVWGLSHLWHFLYSLPSIPPLVRLIKMRITGHVQLSSTILYLEPGLLQSARIFFSVSMPSVDQRPSSAEGRDQQNRAWAGWVSLPNSERWLVGSCGSPTSSHWLALPRCKNMEKQTPLLDVRMAMSYGRRACGMRGTVTMFGKYNLPHHQTQNKFKAALLTNINIFHICSGLHLFTLLFLTCSEAGEGRKVYSGLSRLP